MIRLEIDGQQHAIGMAEVFVGSDEECAIRLTGDAVRSRHASVQAMSDGSVAVRRADPDAEIHVNGILLGGDPTPILHGDKITIGDRDILVVEAENVGSTQHIDVADLAALGVVPAPGSETASTNPLTGGRLVCLTDGREYTIGHEGAFFGREAGSDIVVTAGEVSRRHAQILPTPDGYVLNDSSTNGTYVNGDRVQGSRILVPGDILKIGDDEFRFSAQVASGTEELVEPAPEPPPPPPPPPPMKPLPKATGPRTAPPGAASRLNNTMMGFPAFKPETTPPAPEPSGGARSGRVLATLLVRRGPLKGERFPILVPIANVGRAEYNDVVLPDPSVSQAHAKLQRRDNVWVVSDLGSTNGTTVDDEPVGEETAIAPGATIKFGEIPVLFDATEGALEEEAPLGTRVVPALGDEAPAPPPVKSAAPRATPRIVASGGGASPKRNWWLPAIIVAALMAAAYYFFWMR
jgi:pSer/pThr/pTyr-binding forkhead associated (FHA) protein